MTYTLGVDLGTTYTAAAIARNGRPEVVNLGNRSTVVPSVVFLKSDDTMLVGEAALRRGRSEPGRFAREFKRRIGDPTPILLGGSAWSAEALMARLLRWTIDAVSAREGGPPAQLAVSHPANWGPYKMDLLAEAVRLADAKVDRYISEPEAAAVAYAHAERVLPGSVVAVYDLGGGTFDAAVLRKTDEGFEILGTPEGIDRLGGVDFDQAMLAHVMSALGSDFDALGPSGSSKASAPTMLATLTRLRQECVEGKEALSSDGEVSVAVVTPDTQTEVRVTRAEFEAMIRPQLADTVTALRRALKSAGVVPSDVATVLLVGGSSRIPLVAELLGRELGRPVAVDAHPKHGVALGAALALAGTPMVPTVEPPAAPPAAPPVRTPAPPPAPSSPSEPAPTGAAAAPLPPGSSPPRKWVAIVGALLAFALAGPVVIAKRQLADGAEASPTKGSNVVMAQIAFEPSGLIVARGTAVTFENRDVAPHTVTEIGGPIDSGLLSPGKTFTLVVNRPLDYLCTVHPSMKAKIFLSG